MKRRGISLRILWLFAHFGPWSLSKKEIRRKLDLPPDTEITARIRDLRKPEYGSFAIPRPETVLERGKILYRYHLRDSEEVQRAKEFLKSRER